MYFDLLSEQKQFAESADRLLSDSVDLTAMTKGAEAIDAIRRQLTPALSALGATSVLVPESQGGLGMGLLTLAVLADCVGRYAAPSNALHSALAAWLVAESRDETLCRSWLEPLMHGKAQAAFALNEEPGVWAPGEWRCASNDERAMKYNVIDAEYAQLIIAGLRDGLLFIDASAAEIVPPDKENLDMTRRASKVRFAPGAGRLIDPKFSERLYDALLVLTAADASAAGRRAYEMAVEYAKIREQFGRPIGSFQGLKHQLADMAVDIEPAQFLCWHAAHAWDQNATDSARSAALAKSHAADVAVKTARASLEAHGGIGYTWEYPLHLLLKRAMQDRIVLGASGALRKRVACLTSTMRAS